MTDTAQHANTAIAAKMSTLDRLLPVWIGAAMLAGLLAVRWVPGLGWALDTVQIDGVSLPNALGLLVMMHPVLAKVRYDRLDTATGDKRLDGLLARAELGPRASAHARPRLDLSYTKPDCPGVEPSPIGTVVSS